MGKKRSRSLFLSIGFILILIAIVLFIFFFLHGETKVEGEFHGALSKSTLICDRHNQNYPFFEYDNAEYETTTVNIIFNNNKLDNIALKHTLGYSDENLVRQSEAYNHASLNYSFQGENLGADALHANYSQQRDKMILTLFAEYDDLNDKVVKYFLINDLDANFAVPQYQRYYESIGFECEILK